MDNEKESKKNKTPWPTKDAMAQIYEKNLWGGEKYTFYSGNGSHNSEIVAPYIQAVSLFLKSFNNKLKVCDLGCGDFNVGKQLVDHTKDYKAVDIVENLIAYNKANFKQKKLQFHCLNIAEDELPLGDCVILRQVLQHLSNHEVKNILDKIMTYKYIILTEHLPSGDFVPNKDIISGQGIRLKKQSGLNLLAPPFNFKPKDQKQLLSFKLKENKGVIITMLYTVF